MSVDATHQRILDRIDNKFDKSDGGFTYDITKAPVIIFNDLTKSINQIIEKIDVEKMNNDDLTRFVYQRTGISRKEATFATGEVLVTGSPHAILAKGSLIAADEVFYEVLTDETIPAAGNIYVFAKCLQSGPVGNMPQGAINSFPVTLEGITSVTNVSAFSNGYFAETDASLRLRYYEKLQTPGASGKKAHYKIWAKEVVGVGDAKVVPTWNGPGTVKVVIMDSNKRAASPELISAVFDHIEEERPIGAIVTVVSCSEKLISSTAKVVVANGYNIAQLQTAFAESLTKRFAEVAFKESYLSYARIGNILLDVPGVGDYEDLKVNNLTSNVLLNDEEIPVLSTVTLGVR